MRKSFFLVLVLSMTLIVGCGKSEAAKIVEASIDAIGEVTIDSENDIKRAEEQYASLSEKDKNSVSNYAKLLTARTEYEDALNVAEEKAAENARKEAEYLYEMSKAVITTKSGEEVRKTCDELKEECDANKDAWGKKYKGASIAFIGTVKSVHQEDGPGAGTKWGFKENVIEFEEGWELILNAADKNEIVQILKAGDRLVVNSNIIYGSIFDMRIGGCKEDGSYNAETLVTTQIALEDASELKFKLDENGNVTDYIKK